jgi:hypothetical protein
MPNGVIFYLGGKTEFLQGFMENGIGWGISGFGGFWTLD